MWQANHRCLFGQSAVVNDPLSLDTEGTSETVQ